ncbi:MAG: hypothetical protein Tsb0020_00650 [Haliangiales bacterium]
MLDPQLLEQPAPDAASAGPDPRVHQAAELAGRGDYTDAAELSEMLLRDGSYDIRAVGFYLFGLILQEGLATLPYVLERLTTLLNEDHAALTPLKKLTRVTDDTVGWLFRTLFDRCRYHASCDDEVWQAWRGQLDVEWLHRVEAAIEELRAALVQFIERDPDADRDTPPRCSELSNRFERWLKSDLRPLLAREAKLRANAERAAAAAAEVAPGVGGDGDHRDADDVANLNALNALDNLDNLNRLDDFSADHASGARPATRQRASAAPGAGDLDSEEAPAMQLLRRKLRAFETLVERQDVAKAAIVASDLREIVQNFDPVVYLPKLFASYFRLLAASVDELLPYWMDSESPGWQAMEQFYRADLDAFLDD